MAVQDVTLNKYVNNLPRRRWEDNIKIDLKRTGALNVNWLRLPQDRIQWRAVVNTVMNLWAP
jgi:hypothetical protein